jgi:ribulose-phosphate 3-epimerase
MKKVSVSILASKNLTKDIKRIDLSKADYIHIDVADDKFVKNKFNPYKLLYKMQQETNKRLDVHLMEKKPKKNIHRYAALNSEYITIHVEIEKVEKYIEMIKQYGIKVGLAINPNTDEEMLEPYLNDIDLIIVMGVYPGLGGQTFLEDTDKKVLKIKNMIVKSKRDIKITVDGGVNEETSKRLDFADILVSGSYVLSAENIDERIELLKNNADKLKTTKRTERRQMKEENEEKKKEEIVEAEEITKKIEVKKRTKEVDKEVKEVDKEVKEETPKRTRRSKVEK